MVSGPYYRVVDRAVLPDGVMCLLACGEGAHGGWWYGDGTGTGHKRWHAGATQCRSPQHHCPEDFASALGGHAHLRRRGPLTRRQARSKKKGQRK